ncbi:cytochrome P450 2C3-like [Branchiostoma floridae x Branchiostoma japonicum]
MAGTAQWVAESVQEILQISGLTLQTLLVFCATFLLACVIFKRSQNLPSYPAGRVPVLGHLLALGRAPLRKLTAWRRQYGDVFTVRMGMEDVVVLNGYTAVRDALVDRSELFASKLPVYLLDAMSGFGKDIVAASWSPGYRQRKRFATTVLKNLGMKVGRGSIEDNIREEAICLRSRIAENNGRSFDIAHDVTVAVANVICSMVFGKRYDYEDETFRELSKAIVTLFSALGQGQIIAVLPLLRFVPVVNRAFNNAWGEYVKLRNVCREEISRHQEHLDRENPRDFIDFCLLEVEKQEKVDGLTEENVLYMTGNLFMAGTDTTSNTLLWSLLYMILNPDIQNKVHEELDAVVGESQPALSHRSQLPYVQQELDAVVGESQPALSHRSQLPYVQQELDAVVGESQPALSHRSQLPYVQQELDAVVGESLPALSHCSQLPYVQQELDAVVGESQPALSHRSQLPYVQQELDAVVGESQPALSHRSQLPYVHEEFDAVVGASLPTLSHRSQLPYVNACLMETM